MYHKGWTEGPRGTLGFKGDGAEIMHSWGIMLAIYESSFY